MTTTGRSYPDRRSHPRRRPDPSRVARLQRDAGLDRVRSITRGVAVGSVAGLAVFGVYVSQALPGHAATTSGSSAGAVPPTSPSASTPTPSTPSTPSTTPSAAPSNTVPAAGSPSGNEQSGSGGYGSSLSAPATVPAPSRRQAPVTSGSS
ncbi:MAG: hypothetical protein ACLQPH_15870 [Acidimicrobiales bacterium]